jgi:hypothetical protein
MSSDPHHTVTPRWVMLLAILAGLALGVWVMVGLKWLGVFPP